MLARQLDEDNDDDSVAQPVEEPENPHTVAFAACTWHIGQMQEESNQKG